MARLKRLYKGTLPLFLVLWAIMMGVLAWLNAEVQEAKIQNAMVEAEKWAKEDYAEIWNGTAPEARKPVILTGRLSGSTLFPNDASAQFRVYDSEGKELARSQLTMGSACPFGTGTYSWYLFFDPVLTEEEHLSLARWLKEDWRRRSFHGTAGGLYEDSETDGLYCEVVGVADEERQVIYPQKVTYYYTDREIVLVDSQSDFFEGKELTVHQFDAVEINSALEGWKASPKELLGYYRETEEKLDRTLEGKLPARNIVSTSSDGSGYGPIGETDIFVSAYTYGELRAALTGLGPTALFTLVAAVGMAVLTDRRQRQALERERAFTRAAAHELKTPLAILRTHAEALKEDIDPAKRDKYLDILVDESDRMASLVGGLLDLSRLEAGAELVLEELDLTALVREALERMARPMEEKGLTVTADLDPVVLSGDRLRLEQMASNLLSNALRHCPAGGEIWVTLARKGDRARLMVGNDGPTIPAEDLPRLWEPFYRVDRSRDRTTGGTGLGLAIVKRAAEAHGGTCGAENIPGGVRFWVELPHLHPAH